MQPSLAVVRAFVAAINAGDVAGIASLMTEGHRFVDATGAAHSGRQPMSAGWRHYFAMFPDYRIEIEQTVAEGDAVAAFGWAAGSFHGDPEKRWKIPAAFGAVVRDGLIAEWRVYADIEPMLRSAGMER